MVRGILWGTFLLIDIALATQVLPEPLQLAATGGTMRPLDEPDEGFTKSDPSARPRLASLQATAVGITTAQLLWRVEGEGEVSTHAACRPVSAGGWHTFEADGLGTRIWPLRGLVPGTSYRCQLVALDELGVESAPAVVTFQTLVGV